ncbi:ABC transporter permease [Roseospira marina]|uniref:Transport permease protein n=1 Tax=Roseospira marina TaxID=140057 RepID=A0A5M6IBL7_9PROT|nr:ABC transporter permease [Roseospira marina]KAA5605512.1 ABC transporter permease [Roseospira marina]MBB4314481.1 ABC-2 type transport system permease protein [Roseospira marina]MBB5088691.1 ABC-2 type transport system permease protein [Roseospira marina]
MTPPEAGSRLDPRERSAAQGFAFRRVYALILRHWYLMRGSLPRLLELAYWPIMQMITWGFLTQFLARESSLVAQAAGIFIAAVLLWDVMFRGNLGISLSFMEEMWARNLGHLFVSPLRPLELVTALMAMSIIRTLIGIVPATLLAWLFYAYNIYEMGLPLLAFFVNMLVMGWVIGLLVSALVLRVGLGAESLPWILIFAFWPISGIYYPMDVLPVWLQVIGYSFPPAHVFEGMRQVMLEGTIAWGHLVAAVVLNGLYLSAAAAFFLRVFTVARVKGLLLNIGE